MKNFRYILFLIFFLPSLGQASTVSYEVMESFHKTKIDSIMQEYNLENRMKISYSLSPIFSEDTKAKQIIKLPGLLLDAVALNSIKQEVGLVEIIEALKVYKREVVILQSSSVSAKELEVVQKALQDDLFIKSPEAFTVKKWSGNTGYQKFKSSLYSNVLMSPKVYMAVAAFLIISLLLFMLANSILSGFKHVGKSIYDSVEKSFSAQQSAVGMGAQSFDDSGSQEKEDAKKEAEASEAAREVIEEYNDVTIDCAVILKLLETACAQKPNETSFKMWDVFPEVEDQLNLYVTFESQLEEHEMPVFTDLFRKMFNVENSMNGQVELRPKSFNASRTLWALQVSLTHLSVKPFDEEREKLFGVFLGNYQGQIEQIVDESVHAHYKVLNHLFPERVMDKVQNKSQINEDLSHQIIDFMMMDADERVPNELEIKSFQSFLERNDYFVNSKAEMGEDLEIDILSRLPDHILFSAESKMDGAKLEDLKYRIPNFSWLASADKKVHKQFLLSLNPNEATYFMNHYAGYSGFKQDLDSRTLSRLQELKIKSTNDESTQVILGLRKKIKYFYSPVAAEQTHDVDQAA